MIPPMNLGKPAPPVDAPWVFIPKLNGLLNDNVKYLFLHASSVRRNCWFLTPLEAAAETVRQAGYKAMAFADPRAAELMRAAEHLFVDAFEFGDYLPAFCWQGKSIIQLWHGSPLKKIGLPEAYSPRDMDPAKRKWLVDRYSGYRAVVSPSPLYNRIFTMAFETQQVWMTGYPRTDVLLREPRPEDALFVDSAYAALQTMDKRIRLAVFMPTFRDQSVSVLLREGMDWVAFNSFLRQHHVLLAVKLHPGDRQGMALFERQSFTNIIPLDPASDVYPILRLSAMLISDYSSIVADYLLLDKPVVFFMPDFAEYMSQTREFFFDPLLMCPGEVCTTLTELASGIEHVLEDGGARFASDRELVKRLTNSHQDGRSCERILEVLTASALAATSVHPF